MRITAKGSIKSNGYILTAGDSVTVPDDIGAVWVSNGWAINEQTGENKSPNNEPITLSIHGAKHAQGV